MNILDAPLYIHALIILCLALLGAVGGMCIWIDHLKQIHHKTVSHLEADIKRLRMGFKRASEVALVHGEISRQQKELLKHSRPYRIDGQLPLPQRDSDRMQCANCGATGETDAIQRGECCDQEYQPGTDSKARQSAIETRLDDG